MKHKRHAQALLMIVAALMMGLIGHWLLRSETVHAQPPFTTVITVDATADLEADRTTYTCGLEIGFGGALGRPAPDGKCTLRRAIYDASNRPSTDLPIAIHFNIPITDSGYSPLVTGTWVVSVTKALPLLSGSQITIDGSSQPGGRSDGPPIIIDTSDFSLEIPGLRNVVRNLALKNGGAILVGRDAISTTIENIWMGLNDDGQSVQFRTPSQYNRMAFGGIRLASSGNIVRQRPDRCLCPRRRHRWG
ncbi:MAG: hypothetical protein R2932_12505 [Caldilineaceae bacterium]